MAETRPALETPTWFVEPSFTQRFAAAWIDGALLVGLGILAGVLIDDGGPQIWFVPAVAAVYTIGAIALAGRTIGKALLGLRVVDFRTGELTGLASAGVRWLVPAAPNLLTLLTPGDLPATFGWLAPIVTLAIYWGVLRAPLHRGLHDLAAGTIVTARPRTDAQR